MKTHGDFAKWLESKTYEWKLIKQTHEWIHLRISEQIREQIREISAKELTKIGEWNSELESLRAGNDAKLDPSAIFPYYVRAEFMTIAEV